MPRSMDPHKWRVRFYGPFWFAFCPDPKAIVCRCQPFDTWPEAFAYALEQTSK